jgi:hypothetical protein
LLNASRRFVIQAGMRTNPIAVRSPVLDHDLGLEPVSERKLNRAPT